MLYKVLLVLCSSIALFKGGALCSVLDAEEMNEEAGERQQSYVLPLSYDDDAPILIVPVPESFALAFDGSAAPDVLFLEFAPQEATAHCKSEMITLCHSDQLLDAHQFIKIFKTVIEEMQALESYSNYTSYVRCGLERGIKVGYYVSEHPWIDPRRKGIAAPYYVELLHIKTVQADDRVWVIQYAIRYDPRTISEEERDAVLEKMHTFFKSCKVSFNVTGLST